MKIKDFFEEFSTPEMRRLVIVDLVTSAMSKAGLDYREDEDADPNDVIFVLSGAYDYWFSLKPEEKHIEFNFPLFGCQYHGL